MPQIIRRLEDWLSPLVILSSNWISRIGVFLVTTAVVSGILLLPVAVGQGATSAYLGLIAFVALPILMLVGLALIPAGIAFHRRRAASAATGATEEQRHALSAQAWSKLFRFLAVATVLNVIIGGYGAYSSVHYMETNAFCGATCHVMQPENIGHQVGAHANVECVECHVGPGAAGYIQAKLGGVRQLALLLTDTYQRPISGAAERMTPVAPRCEQCHSQFRDAGDKIRIKRSYTDDEANTPSTTVLVVHAGKIHAAHASTDCLECHNRPAHAFTTAEAGVDQALADGSIARMLPFAKKEGVAILAANYANRQDAAAKIPMAWESYYREQHSDVWMSHRAEITGSGQALAAIYAHNVFPEMKVTFGTYKSLLGHTETEGCFRCHDGSSVTQDCSTCHDLVSMQESEPAVLSTLGMRP